MITSNIQVTFLLFIRITTNKVAHMIEKLKQIEDKKILELLSKPELWQTKLVDYFPPIVERCWIQLGNYRLLLHFIHPCKPEEALFHTHRWPSSMHVLFGKYEMGLGFGEGDVPPPKMATVIFDNGGYYDMPHIDAWHYVRPIESVCATVMLTGKVWDRGETSKEFGELKPLSEARKLVLLEWFSNWYREKIEVKKVEENKNISHGDWVKIDENIMSEYDKRKLSAYLGIKGFVIKKEGLMVDIRFGNDRIQINTKSLILLESSEKPEKITDKKEIKKHIDPMDPKSWEDDSEEI